MLQLLEYSLGPPLAGAAAGLLVALVILGPRRFMERMRELKP